MPATPGGVTSPPLPAAGLVCSCYDFPDEICNRPFLAIIFFCWKFPGDVYIIILRSFTLRNLELEIIHRAKVRRMGNSRNAQSKFLNLVSDAELLPPVP